MTSTTTTNRATVARRVRAGRAYAGLSRPELAARAQLAHASLAALERGSYHVVGDELERVVSACGVTRRC